MKEPQAIPLAWLQEFHRTGETGSTLKGGIGTRAKQWLHRRLLQTYLLVSEGLLGRQGKLWLSLGSQKLGGHIREGLLLRLILEADILPESRATRSGPTQQPGTRLWNSLTHEGPTPETRNPVEFGVSRCKLLTEWEEEGRAVKPREMYPMLCDKPWWRRKEENGQTNRWVTESLCHTAEVTQPCKWAMCQSSQ